MKANRPIILFMDSLPTQLYSASQTRQLDKLAIDDFKIPGYTLMNGAGEAVFEILKNEFPLTKRILVCCGAGNNAGDGYVIARLAHKAGMDVSLVSLVDVESLTGDARQACQDWKSVGHQLTPVTQDLFESVDVVIDALLGTGIDREVTGEWRELIELINHASVPVIAVDVPSGLSADTGTVFGTAVKADMTVSFIGLNKGLFTHMGPDHAGRVMFSDLQLPAAAYQPVSAEAHLLDWDELKTQLVPRSKNSHKHNFGHVLVIGGDYGMAGAVRLAGEAALRCGAGLVSIVTRAEHVTAITSACPELMVAGSENGNIPQSLLNKAQVIVIGPGLGQQAWGMKLLSRVMQSRLPKLLDADALNLLSRQDGQAQNWILTPHPGEAAHLLGLSSAEIQRDRFGSIEQLQQIYGGVVVLKGCGSLISSDSFPVKVCPYGNPGMASAGMGDVLSGIIGALIAQGLSLADAASLGVCLHAKAGDQAALMGERGLCASDLFAEIRQLVNPDS